MKRFRFSLLTLVSGVLLLATVMHLNLRPHPLQGEPHYLALDVPETVSRREICIYGWPSIACKEYRITITERPLAPLEDWSKARPCPWKDGDAAYEWYQPSLAANILLGLVIIIGGTATCEFVVRRRTKKEET